MALSGCPFSQLWNTDLLAPAPWHCEHKRLTIMVGLGILGDLQFNFNTQETQEAPVLLAYNQNGSAE